MLHLCTLAVGLCFVEWVGVTVDTHIGKVLAFERGNAAQTRTTSHGDTQVTGPVTLRASPENLLRKTKLFKC